MVLTVPIPDLEVRRLLRASDNLEMVDMQVEWMTTNSTHGPFDEGSHRHGINKLPLAWKPDQVDPERATTQINWVKNDARCVAYCGGQIARTVDSE